MSLDALHHALYPAESLVEIGVYEPGKSSEFQAVVTRLVDILGERNLGLIGAHIFRMECFHTLGSYDDDFPKLFLTIQGNELRQLEEEHSALPQERREEIAAARATLRIAQAVFMQTLIRQCNWQMPLAVDGDKHVYPYALYDSESVNGFMPLGENDLEAAQNIEYYDYWFYIYQTKFNFSEIVPRTLCVRFTYGDHPRFRLLYSSAQGVTRGNELMELI